MWHDICNYSSNVKYLKSFINNILLDIREQPLDSNTSVDFCPKEFGAFCCGDFATYKFESSSSVCLYFMLMDDGLRIDVGELYELIEYDIEDIRQNKEKIIREIKEFLVSDIRIKHYCSNYVRVELVDDNNNILKSYRYIRGIFAILYFWMCEPVAKLYKPIFQISNLEIRKTKQSL